MSIKKISAAVMAAAVLAVGAPVMGMADPLGVVASAAEEKLLTTDVLSKDFPNTDLLAIGEGYYVVMNADDWGNYSTVAAIIHIDFDNWRKTGTFAYTNVKSDVDLSNVNAGNLNILNGYISFKSNGVYYLMKIDKSADKLVKVKESADATDATVRWIYEDGYTVSTGETENGWKYAVTAPDGKKVEDTLTYTSSGENDSYNVYIAFYDMGEYIGFIAWKVPGTTFTKETEWGTTADYAKYEIYGVKKDGTRTLLDTVSSKAVDEYGMSWPFNNSWDKYTSWFDDNGALCIFTVDDGKVHKINGLKNLGRTEIQLFGSKAAIVTLDTVRFQGPAKVVDLADNCKVLWESERVDGITVIDNGKLYYVSDRDGGYRYLDSSFNVIKNFGMNGAATFVGDGLYVPIYDYETQKVYLIDKNLNQVSEKIDGNRCAVVDDQLFRYEKGDGSGYVYFTSSSNGVAKSDTSDSGTAVSDKFAGVSVTGVPGAAKVKVSSKKKDDGSYTYDITPVDASGNTVQPDGMACVMIVPPAELKGKTLNVYRVADGKYTKMNSWADGDMLYFTTTHFSEFEITTAQREEANPDTGSTGVFGLAAVSIAAVGVMLVSRKKK